MEFSCRCHLTTGGITSLTLLPIGLWAPGCPEAISIPVSSNHENIIRYTPIASPYLTTIVVHCNRCLSVEVGVGPQSGEYVFCYGIDMPWSCSIERNKLPALRPNSYLHTQTSEIQVTTKWSKQPRISFAAMCTL